MRLVKARIQGYRSIIDSGWFDIEQGKSILVGPNEAGKTAILQALQKLNPPEGVELFKPLRDYPRAKYDEDIEKGGVDPSTYTDPIFNLLTGGLLLGSVFMATDYVTSPMSAKGGIIFGVGIGLITMLIRYFGAYPEGVSFAILIMNSTVPLINKFCKSKKYGR